MGACSSKSNVINSRSDSAATENPQDVKQATARSKEIDKQLDEKTGKEIKILLLGTAETGKSTVLKQLRIIHGTGFTENDIQIFRSAARKNIYDTIRILIDAMVQLTIPYGFDPKVLDPKKFPSGKISNGSRGSGDDLLAAASGIGKNAPVALEASRIYQTSDAIGTDEQVELTRSAVAKVKSFEVSDFKTPLPHDLTDVLKLLWADSGVRYCFSRSNEFQIIDLSYFMQDIDKFNSNEYIPTNQDILASRVMTSGVGETQVMIRGMVFRVFDVGGQRNERRKWIHVFDNVNAIFFLVDLSAFNQVTVEDSKINRIVESLTVFSYICNHPGFKKTAIVIFMNKMDLLKEKLDETMVADYFPEFRGSNDVKEVSRFFADKITFFNKNPDRQLYFHYTQANDTSKMKVVLATVIESILV
ncbi:hypothetical protein HK100_011909 [Physocladia obscura]|uniref:Uncharacterized protein n=1 Tax=Physocladia obscura TaxID=109957 RepID=A0AAD5T3F3_9FUNG|nr:hypothetical protein HK100_011909 [Physocladia obscura]